MAQVLAFIKMLVMWWNQLLIFIGMIKKAQHEHKQDEIKDKTDVISNPDSTEDQTHDATQELEDNLNKHT